MKLNLLWLFQGFNYTTRIFLKVAGYYYHVIMFYSWLNIGVFIFLWHLEINNKPFVTYVSVYKRSRKGFGYRLW